MTDTRVRKTHFYKDMHKNYQEDYLTNEICKYGNHITYLSFYLHGQGFQKTKINTQKHVNQDKTNFATEWRKSYFFGPNTRFCVKLHTEYKTTTSVEGTTH